MGASAIQIRCSRCAWSAVLTGDQNAVEQSALDLRTSLVEHLVSEHELELSLAVAIAQFAVIVPVGADAHP